MLETRAVEAELARSLGLSMAKLEPLLAAGGDAAERKFMECCWCLWKANGAELVEPFVEAAFNNLPEKSRSVLFQRMLTIVYVAQESEIKEEEREREHDRPGLELVADRSRPVPARREARRGRRSPHESAGYGLPARR